jgi:hypothetical protein
MHGTPPAFEAPGRLVFRDRTIGRSSKLPPDDYRVSDADSCGVGGAATMVRPCWQLGHGAKLQVLRLGRPAAAQPAAYGSGGALYGRSWMIITLTSISVQMAFSGSVLSH